VNSAARSTILGVEGNEDVRKLLQIFLKHQQYLLVEASNCKEAVKLLQFVIPDLIIMDLNMPKMDGIQAVEEIRQNTELEKIPILINSADGTRGIDFFLNVNKFGKGYIEYLTKPLNNDELPKLINKVLFQTQNNLQSAA
jgi:chemosensory pili system protein ChpA (sensor histidine kinase/response regulator)